MLGIEWKDWNDDAEPHHVDEDGEENDEKWRHGAVQALKS
jgi:hypothetical protein